MRKHRKQFTLEPLESRCLLAVITVNTTQDANPNSSVLTLRQAIQIADGTLAVSSLSPQQQAQVSGPLSTPNTIAFSIPGSGVQTIAPTSALPYITAPVIIDGYTQPGASPNTSTTTDNAVLKIQISGASAGPSTDGLYLNGLGASSSTIRGLILNNWGLGGHVAGQPGGRAIVIYQSGGGNLISGNFIGTDSTGTVGVPNAVGGIQLDHSIADSIGGPNPADRNVILVGGNTSTGTPSMWGIYASNSIRSIIQGNFVGVDATGNQFVGFKPAAGVYGLNLVDSTGISVGGGTTGNGNVVSSVWIGTLSGNVIQSNSVVAGNTIGYNASHTLNLTGATGVVILNAAGNLIGGASPASGNLIGSVGGVGIDVLADNHAANLNTLIEGNTIGAIPPTSIVFRGFDGIRLSSSGNIVGGLNPALANTIGHNTSFGVEVYNLPGGTTPTSGFGLATNNQILSNVIFDSGTGSIGTSLPAPQTPVMKLVAPTPNGTLLLTGVVGNGVPGASYLVQFYVDISASQNYPVEAERLLTTEKVTAAANGLILYSTVVPTSWVPTGSVIIANATPTTGNTSQYSAGVPVGAPVSSGVAVNITSGTPRIGQPVSVAANVTSDAVNWVSPTGKMVLYDNGVALAVTNVVGTGYGYFTIPSLSPGVHSLVVKYSGDAVFPGATSPPTIFVGRNAAPPLPLHVVSVQRVSSSGNQTDIAIKFSSPLDPSAADNANNYQLVALKQQGNSYVATGKTFGVTSASYNAATQTVTIVPSIGLSSTTLYALTVQGGIRSTLGALLDGADNGTPGSSYQGRV